MTTQSPASEEGLKAAIERLVELTDALRDDRQQSQLEAVHAEDMRGEAEARAEAAEAENARLRGGLEVILKINVNKHADSIWTALFKAQDVARALLHEGEK